MRPLLANGRILGQGITNGVCDQGKTSGLEPDLSMTLRKGISMKEDRLILVISAMKNNKLITSTTPILVVFFIISFINGKGNNEVVSVKQKKGLTCTSLADHVSTRLSGECWRGWGTRNPTISNSAGSKHEMTSRMVRKKTKRQLPT